MPIPVPSNVPVGTQPKYYVRERQDWAVQQERDRQREALYSVGEYLMFLLMWHEKDFQAGLVEKCSRCFGSGNAVDDRIAAVYEQPTQNKCPVCYGTTFEGGVKATIIRPGILHDADKDEKIQARGVTHSSELSIESTSDFRVRNGDYCLRQTGERYYLRAPERLMLRSGFSTPTQTADNLTYNNLRASLEDKTSVAYIIPPVPGAVAAILSFSGHQPVDFSAYETIHAPLIPVDDDG